MCITPHPIRHRRARTAGSADRVGAKYKYPKVEREVRVVGIQEEATGGNLCWEEEVAAPKAQNNS